MKAKIFYGIFLVLLAVAPFGILSATTEAEEPEVRVEKVGIKYGYDRPFSFYYPYQYQFYYPRHRYKPSSSACYWLYTNGSYVYSCK